MKVHVVFTFSDIEDQDSEEASETIQILQDDLKRFSSTTGHNWYIDDATGEQE